MTPVRMALTYEARPTVIANTLSGLTIDSNPNNNARDLPVLS